MACTCIVGGGGGVIVSQGFRLVVLWKALLFAFFVCGRVSFGSQCISRITLCAAIHKLCAVYFYRVRDGGKTTAFYVRSPKREEEQGVCYTYTTGR